MSANLSRRNWLRSSAFLTTCLMTVPGLRAVARPAASAAAREKLRSWEHTMKLPLDQSRLRARLNANENPFGPSDKVRLAVMESVATGNRYGHQDAALLRSMIAEKEGVPEEYILLSPGSTDLLEKVAITQFVRGGNVVSADPAYMSLIKTAMAFDADWKQVPLTADYAHDLPAMEAAVDADTRLVYVCNPNNPTGSITSSAALKAFCSRVSERVPVFVDEAYLEYLDDPAGSTMAGLVAAGKNVIVARTFSKIHAMAGLRMGYMVALPETIEKITSMVRSTMGLCITSLRGAMASLNDTSFHEDSRAWTKENREFVYAELKKIGFDYIPSYTSFILFPIDMPGDTFLKKMYEEGVGVRAFTIDGKPYCRVSMGTAGELKIFMDTLKKVLV